MRTIICLKNAGVSVNDIGKFIHLRLMGDSTLNQRYHLLEDHEEDLQRQINDLQETLSYLKFKKWYYETAVDVGTESLHFVPDSNEVKPDLDQEYMAHLKENDEPEELQRFLNVRDYRNKR
nr:MerR family DNA-binding protein [Secundilactobacillus paracollinoides]